MKKKIFTVIVHLMVFWIVTDLFDGIEVTGGIFAYITLGLIWGLATLIIKRVIRFFTIDVNFWTIAILSVLFGIIIFTGFNFIAYGISFSESTFSGYSNELLTIKAMDLDMVGNIVAGGVVMGLLSGLLIWLADNK